MLTILTMQEADWFIASQQPNGHKQIAGRS